MIFLILVAVTLFVIVARKAHIPAPAGITIMAVLMTGAAAGAIVSPIVFATTLLLAGLMVRSVMQSQQNPRVATIDVSNLPPTLQATVASALNDLPDGAARGQLLGLLAEAHPLYAMQSTTFDEREERGTRRHVDELIDACCASALELHTIDAAVAAAPARPTRAAGTASTPSGEVDARLVSARALVVRRLSDARTALRTLYAAGVEQGTSASERVASLAAEIKADASARRAAIADVNALLR